MRSIVVTSLLALAALSGCISTDSDVDPNADALLDEPLYPALDATIGWTGCRIVIASVAVSKDVIQPHLPEGFAAADPSTQGAPDDPHGDATLGVEAFQCAGADNGNGDVGTIHYGSYWTYVDPPAELAKEGYEMKFFKWKTALSDDAFASSLAEYGLPIKTGTTEFDSAPPATTTFQQAPTGTNVFQVGLTWDEGLIGFNGMGQIDLGQSEISFIEYQESDGGIATWEMSLENADISVGAGYVKFNVGTWGEELLGQERVPATFLSGTMNLAEGLIHVPEIPWEPVDEMMDDSDA